METLNLAGTVLGGLGLFLLAIGMMTDGLRLAAGNALRRLLSEWSRTPLRGIFSGFLMTAIVQSSSAVTVASLGFVNAGLISMRQALGIIYGANVGTTMTGWLVALIGFKLNIPAVALPMIGVGMLMKLIRQQGQAASLGMALVGFGLFFLGIDVLKTAFEGIVATFDITQFSSGGVSGILILLLIGVIMTILTQSSSASIALTITAASSGILSLHAAGAMVIGANIGTTSTALLASIGATSNARRVAAAQVIFNVGTALVALLILPLLFYLLEQATRFFELSAAPAVSLALFHTVFNLLGVALIYPHNDRLAGFLEDRFRSAEEKASRPRYLDRTVAQTPVLAVNALLNENLLLADRLIAVFASALQPKLHTAHTLAQELMITRRLSSAISRFIVSVERTQLNAETTEDLAMLMRVEQYFSSSAVSAERIAHLLESRETLGLPSFEKEYEQYFQQLLEYMRGCRDRTISSADELQAGYERLQEEHERLKACLITFGTQARISVEQMSESIDALAEAVLLGQHWYKAFIRLRALQGRVEVLKTETNQEQ